MERLELNHFRAFNNPLTLDDAGAKNVLLFGENGAGKSSLYSALEYIFYRERIEIVNPMLPVIEQQAELEAIRGRYKNNQSPDPFSLKFNGEDVYEVNTTPYQVFLLNRFDKVDYISLYNVLEKSRLPVDINAFLAHNYSDIIENVNIELAQSFLEPIKIELVDRTDGYVVIVINKDTGLRQSKNLDKYFNEAIINLVQLLIWFSAVQLMVDITKKRILVLDDFITSLDAANRAYMMRFILKTFTNEQLIIFTHDYSLFNVTAFLISYVYRVCDQWRRYKLYMMGDEHTLDVISKISIKELRQECKKAGSYDSIGNKVRKCFEQRLYDLAAELSIGQLEKTSDIIDCLSNSKNIYYNPKASLSDLISDIESMLPTISDSAIRDTFSAKIDEFKIEFSEEAKMKETVNLLRFYQKISMHPISHGTIGTPHYCKKDVEEAINLLEQLDKCVKSILDGKV